MVTKKITLNVVINNELDNESTTRIFVKECFSDEEEEKAIREIIKLIEKE